jgi:hypothetical protein
MSSRQEKLDALRELSAQQLWLRVVIAVSPLVCLVASSAAGRVATIVVPIVVLLAIMSATRPDSHAGVVLIATLVWQWMAGVDDAGSAWTIVAALAVLVLHTSMAACTIAAPSAALSAEMLSRWGRRTAAVGGVVVIVWLLAVALRQTRTPGNVGLAAGGALAVVGLLALAWPRSA